jgi:SAM-dependent methyltransferase
MLKLTDHFNSLATGASQVPLQSLRSHLISQSDDSRIIAYHDYLISKAGPLFLHFLASVPYILEELCRVGVALTRLARAYPKKNDQAFSLFEVDAFDGCNGRALASHSQGMIRSLTSSPNRANHIAFERHADPAFSKFYPQSFLKVRPSLLERPEYVNFNRGFDFIYEMAAFQFYSRDRESQLAHIKQFLKPGGLAFFLEKLNHPDPQEYLRREKIKDEKFKTRYFTLEEITWKRRQMLEQMQNGQVSFDELLSALSARFKHVYLLWSSSNFCEFVASDDPEQINRFLGLLGPAIQPAEFCFEGSRHGMLLPSRNASADVHNV